MLSRNSQSATEKEEAAAAASVLLTQTVGQEVGGEALGAVAHGCVVVRVSSEHQHRPAHYHCCVEVTEEAAVSQNGPAQTHSDGCYTAVTQAASWLL